MIGFVTCTLVLIATSCSKDKNTTPPFSATGYWKGSVYLFNCAMLNRDNGTTRFYFNMTGFDSSTAGTKFDGTYTLTNGVYNSLNKSPEGDTLLFETSSTAARVMKGITTIGLQNNTTAAITSEFIKQP